MFRALVATALLLSLVPLSLVPAADPALAQASRKAQPKAAPSPPTDLNALQAWCRQQVFRRYGEPVPGQPNMLQIEMEQSVMKTDGCVRSKGRTI